MPQEINAAPAAPVDTAEAKAQAADQLAIVSQQRNSALDGVAMLQAMLLAANRRIEALTAEVAALKACQAPNAPEHAPNAPLLANGHAADPRNESEGKLPAQA